MKNLTISVYRFDKLRDGYFLYVDKSEYIGRVIKSSGEMYFLSRSRRFGFNKKQN